MSGPLLFDRVMETTTTTGTGTLTLAGAVSGYQTFAAVGNGNTSPYAVWSVDGYGTPTGDWEVGIGTYSTTGPTLARTVVLASSNSGSAVNLAAGTKRIALTIPAATMTVPYAPIGGRLTTESGVPVSTTDRTSQGTLYWTPYVSDYLRLYNGSRIKEYVCSEKSLSLTLTSGKNYDVFLYDSSGTPTLELSAAWTNDTTRADALAWESGLGWVKSGSPTRLHVGTIRASGTNTIEDSGGITGTTQVGGKRFVWNRFNQVERPFKVIDTASYWSYTTGTVRQSNGASGNKVEYVTGDAATCIYADVVQSVNLATNSARAAVSGIGIDSTTTFNSIGIRTSGYTTISGANVNAALVETYRGYPGLGYHYLAWLEYGADGSAAFGYDANGLTQKGLSARLLG